jgi:hypothetical protein
MKLLLAIILFSLQSVHASKKKGEDFFCLRQRLESILKIGKPIDQYLNSFKLLKAIRLADRIFEVSDSEGRNWFIRLGGEDQDLDWEKFSHAFIRKIGLVETTDPMILSTDGAQKLKAQLAILQPEEWKSIIDKEPELKAARISVQRAIHDAPSGKEYMMSKIDQPLDLLGAIIEAKEEMRVMKSKTLRGGDILELIKQWRVLRPEQKQFAISALQGIWPMAKKITRHEDFVDFLIDNLVSGPRAIEEINLQAIESIDKNLRKKISEYWLHCFITGTPDCSPSNWFFKEGKIIAFDLAYPRTGTDVVTIKKLLDIGTNPFDGWQVSERLFHMMVSDASDEFFKRIANITTKQLQELAKENKIPVTDKELKMVMQKIRMLHEMRKIPFEESKI